MVYVEGVSEKKQNLVLVNFVKKILLRKNFGDLNYIGGYVLPSVGDSSEDIMYKVWNMRRQKEKNVVYRVNSLVIKKLSTLISGLFINITKAPTK